MGETAAAERGIAQMPRGGPNASWPDRRLQTEALEYTDRYDIDDDVKQAVISALDWTGSLMSQHVKHAQTVLELVKDIPNPRILELGAGHGKLSAKIVELHPSATVTISDLDPTSVANIAASELGNNPRVRTQVVDATAIDAEDDSYDLVIDLKRASPQGLILTRLAMTPLAVAMIAVRPSMRHVMHDGFISALRAYSPAAFAALGQAVDPQMRIEFLAAPFGFGPRSAIVVFSRPAPTPPGRETDAEQPPLP